MMKYVKTGMVLAAAALMSGCASWANTTPGVGVGVFEFQEWQKGKDYEILGDVQGDACKAKLLWLFTIEGEEKSGTIASGTASQGADSNPFAFIGKLFGPSSEATQAATYNAIEAFKGADLALPVRSKSNKKDYLGFYVRECATVTAKAVRVKP